MYPPFIDGNSRTDHLVMNLDLIYNGNQAINFVFNLILQFTLQKAFGYVLSGDIQHEAFSSCSAPPHVTTKERYVKASCGLWALTDAGHARTSTTTDITVTSDKNVAGKLRKRFEQEH